MNSAITIFILLIIAFIVGYLLRSLLNMLTGRTYGAIRGLMFLALIIWTIFSVWWYVCQTKNLCGSSKETVQISQPQVSAPKVNKVAAPVIAELPSWPLYFNWNSATPQLGETFDSFRKELFQNLPDGNNLEITGYFNASEINQTDFSDLGLARAYNVRELLTNSLSDNNIALERVKLSSAVFSHPDWKVDLPFNLVKFTNMAVQQESSTPTAKPVEFQQIFYFDTNSAQTSTQLGLTSSMTDQINSARQTVEIIGHTDNIGDHTSNRKLAMLRADNIKVLLIKQGVNGDLIFVSAKGEEAPAANNSTSTGREQNRRVELFIK